MEKLNGIYYFDIKYISLSIICKHPGQIVAVRWGFGGTESSAQVRLMVRFGSAAISSGLLDQG